MKLGAPARSISTRVVWVIIISLILLFVVFFYQEIAQVLAVLSDWLGVERDQPVIPFITEQREAGVTAPAPFVFFNCIFGFFVVFWLWMVLISYQALLPIEDILKRPDQAFLEAYRASWYLLFYILRQHGPAVFIRDGQPITTRGDERRTDSPGVIVVDYNSAVVLEERNPPPGIPGAIAKIIGAIFQLFQVYDPMENPRVRGSGIIFTRPRERIKGTVDLRNQFCLQPQVRCYTRDGIELSANVWTIATVGMEAERLEVTFDGLPMPENLRVLRMSALPNGFRRVTGFSDELDEADRKEIYELWQNGHLEIISYNDDDPLPDTFRERVFAAVTSQAQRSSETLPWTDLSPRVAAGFYRELLSQINYDELYDVHEAGEFPLPSFRKNLRHRMRNNGILAFSLVQSGGANTGVPLQPLAQGQVYSEAVLQRSRVRLLKNPKVLRDRGIRVIASGFGELSPVNEEVYRQRLDAWKATWESDLAEQMANSDRAAMFAEGRAKVEAQQELWQSLSMLFTEDECSDEALALRVLQSLDQAAADPRTRALLPANTLGMLQYVHALLLPGDKRGAQQAGGLPGLPAPNQGVR